MGACVAWWTMSMCEASAAAPQFDARRPISVEDVVRLVVIGDPNSITWDDSASNVSVTSPDGERVAVVLRHGDPGQGTNDAELLVYRTAELLHFPRPQIVARFASETNYQPIALVHWLSDNRTLEFAGVQGNAEAQVYRADVRTGSLRQLSNLTSPLQWFGITTSGKSLATISEPITSALNAADARCVKSGCLVTARTLHEAQHSAADTSAPVTLFDLDTGRSQTLAAPDTEDLDLIGCRNELKGAVSPDGRFGLRLCTLQKSRLPAWWADYTNSAARKTALNEYFRTWILYDFAKGKISRLTSAPYPVDQYGRTDPIWIDNGSRVILIGALEPLVDVAAHERERRASHLAILVIDPTSHSTQRVMDFDPSARQMTRAAWNQQTETLTVKFVDTSDTSTHVTAYRRRRSGAWTAATARVDVGSDTDQERPRLLVKQSLNDPPALVAVNPRTGATSEVLNPNAWLADRAIGRVDEISWMSKDGREWKGGLYYPPDYVPGMRYPMVLQTHGFKENTFSLNGVARNFAAQPLAARGIVVLQVAENIKDVTGGAAEWPAAQAGYEAAIDHLDSLGIIDRERVGIQGWSRSGPWMGYTLTKSSYKFAAGVFTITADFGWWWYLSQGGLYGATQYGEPPFGDGLQKWLQMSPSFNLQRINAPMLMCSDGVEALWDWYVGLRQLGKPVEYWSLPDTTHDVFKIGDRLLVNTLVVDWFLFWLKDEQDSDPTKASQYVRWRKLREGRPAGQGIGAQ
jgi:dipeptidyl aminopeptidase/acylaminoacyl peptidase